MDISIVKVCPGTEIIKATTKGLRHNSFPMVGALKVGPNSLSGKKSDFILDLCLMSQNDLSHIVPLFVHYNSSETIPRK